MLTRGGGSLRIAAVADDGEPLERLMAGLGNAERSTAAALRPEARRRDYALGRLAARGAIRGVLGVPRLGRDLEITTGAHGEPIVGNDEAVRVSVSHTKGLAAACAWEDPRWSAGIDVERVRPTDVLDSAYAFSRRERQLIGRLGDRPLAALMGWAVKEASWKAVTLDGSGGPETVEIVALDLDAGRATVRATGALGIAHARVGRIRAAGAEYALAVARSPRPAQNW